MYITALTYLVEVEGEVPSHRAVESGLQEGCPAVSEAMWASPVVLADTGHTGVYRLKQHVHHQRHSWKCYISQPPASALHESAYLQTLQPIWIRNVKLLKVKSQNIGGGHKLQELQNPAEDASGIYK